MLRKSLHIALIAGILLFWASCTTQKNTFLTRTYHNTTSHFNGYFWGKVAYQEGLQKLEDSHKDDYSEVLPVFVYADDKEAQSIYPEMDRAIKKATTMIENHTITNKQKREIPDAVKYIKYCYLLLAKARVYKNDYLTAIQALDYASKEYKKTTVKYEAIMWEARAYNQIGAVIKSEELVDILKSTKDISKKLYPDVCATIADYYMRTGQNDEVVKWLKKAVATEKTKTVKARYYFILAQLAQKSGDMQNAFKLYSEVLKMHPSYDMEFEATINRALLFMGNDKENQNIKKTLVKMLKQTKNSDNKDQIYYALAQISEKENDTTKAITYLQKSVKASTINQRQKAVSYLALADISFNRTNYVNAKKYYDSTLFSLPKNYKGRDSIVSKRDNLQKLVKCLDIITLEDSVLRLSKMPQNDLDKYIDKIIEKAKEEAAEKKREEEIAAENQNNASLNNGNNPVNSPGNGKWYFYNPAQIQMGESEFIQKWGNRPLEDDWRRSKKISHMQDEATAGGNANDTIKNKKGITAGGTNDSLNNIYNRAYYLKNIPRTDAQIKAANDSLVEAFYNAGSIYKEYLKNDAKASEDFEQLLSRYPDNKYKLTVYYQLYRIYFEMNNTERMNYYKNILLSKYPNTEYAQLIANPEKYRRNLKASKEEMTKLYVATLEFYQAGKYPEVLANCQKADTLYPKNPLTPKFAYLEAVAIGATQGLDAYKKALSRVTILYPGDSVKILAQTTLDYLNKKNIPAKDTGIQYSMETDTLYYWIALIDNKEASKINNFRITLSDLNSHTFSQDKLQMDNLLLNPNQQMILVRQFKTAETAKNYYGYVHANNNVFKLFSPGTYQTFYISGKNFHIMFNHRKAAEYMKFFKDKGL